MKEIWKDIKGYEGVYKISTLGRVKSLKRGKEIILKESSSTGGYKVIGLYNNGIKHTNKIHKLVAIAFLGHAPCGLKLVVDHIDNNKLNNNLSNLQIITTRANLSKDRDGTSKYTGVYWHSRSGKWVSQITLNKKRVHLGYFDCEHEAGKSYQDKLKTII
tara:strand:- start:33 stop:512 length:480 start_codon:yes stop_codon:yes gene_type:complete